MECDICGREREVENATVTVRGKTWALVLCDEDAAILTLMAEKGSQGPRRLPGRTVARPTGHRVEPIA